MTKDEALKLALEADLDWQKHWDNEGNRLERFAKLVLAAERNHIAGVFEDNHEVVKHRNNYWLHAANYVRGRGVLIKDGDTSVSFETMHFPQQEKNTCQK